jgi:hypothetical protein
MEEVSSERQAQPGGSQTLGRRLLAAREQLRAADKMLGDYRRQLEVIRLPLYLCFFVY